jgi:hypothetical protein
MPPSQWTGDQEEKARARCAEVFLKDFRTLTEEQRVLLLIDSYDQCPDALNRWIQMRLLLQHALTEPPTRLTVVLAGNERVPDLSNGREQVVHSLSAFSPWENEHIEQYLSARGVPLDPDNVDFVKKGLHKLNWTFDQLKSAVELLKPQDG